MARSIRREPRRGGLKSNARKLLAACVGGVLLLTSGQVEAQQPQDGLLRRVLEVSGEPSLKDNTATCRLTGSSGEAVQELPELTLSEKQLNATLVCEGDQPTRVPTKPENVCQDPQAKAVEVDEKNECKIGASASGSPVPLKTLLTATSQAKWENDKAAKGIQKLSWTLSLSKDDLPLTDNNFYVGCQKGTVSRSSETSACKVPVKILARHSSAEKNVVTCAYGATSNKTPVEVEMTQEQNTLKVVCGTQGSIHPLDYKTHFCEKEEMNACSKSYVDILPKFDEKWWTEEENKSVTLTIPSADFPTEDKSFYVGCTLSKSKNEEPQESPAVAAASGGSGATATTCKVLVTVKAVNSSLSAGAGVGMAAAVSGAAVLTGVLAGSL
ncbi:SAG-related sequence [Besnoitia besnoiti]|uniref:SAG-related sequence n=1 Tax=Besnoitia besnoiti TaxID=94643 RepID=A0A2A9MEL8_BESBE|nr:SAG-related sequence [Besnoitia besnoiti]PFH35654.1 SAG-related sequence [Besnoitia besnoiti]